jgi:hypothetical protein
MPKNTPKGDLPRDVKKRLRELFQRISIPVIRYRIVAEFVTDVERRAIVKDLDVIDALNVVPTKHILTVISEHRNWTLERALLEAGLEMGFLGFGDYRCLRRSIGEPTELETPLQPAGQPKTPTWNHEKGTLCLGTEVIREVRICRHPSRVQRLLEAFESAHWKSSIKSPFDDLTQGDLHRLINEVNRRLTRIRFHGRAGGGEITWSLKQESSVSEVQ